MGTWHSDAEPKLLGGNAGFHKTGDVSLFVAPISGASSSGASGKKLKKEKKKKKKPSHTRARVPLIPLNMPGRYYMGHVLSVSGWSHMKLYRRIKAGKFPKPQKDGDLNYWPTSVVREALGL